jgi:hypothetical protein
MRVFSSCGVDLFVATEPPPPPPQSKDFAGSSSRFTDVEKPKTQRLQHWQRWSHWVKRPSSGLLLFLHHQMMMRVLPLVEQLTQASS